MNTTILLPKKTGFQNRNTQDDEPVLIMSESGMPILHSSYDVLIPANYSFACINNFVHCEDPSNEDLQNLALGMATHIEALERRIAALGPVAQPVLTDAQILQIRDSIELCQSMYQDDSDIALARAIIAATNVLPGGKQ